MTKKLDRPYTQNKYKQSFTLTVYHYTFLRFMSEKKDIKISKIIELSIEDFISNIDPELYNEFSDYMIEFGEKRLQNKNE